ncbi:hypothetical protein [Legionella micdadei]|uniref:hypothetical protein n=1 Tax=Legionella micdadei TaxID=451 RepID=UPI0009EF7043|nr:hypothetical protein [Legionella micdadei]ARH01207.1 hypothetical protein B6V88_12795 [Legionella micdadei]
MIWNDTHLSRRPGVPKWLCYITTCISFIMAYCAIYSCIKEVELMQKIIPAVATPFFIYYGLCGALTILNGEMYVEKIEKEGDDFVLTNIFYKQISFTTSDVLSVAISKFSIMDKFLTGFAKHLPGLDLVLKDGSKYYITSDMEHIATLKQHLLGIVE